MSTVTTRGAGDHAAQNSVAGTISNGVTWYEDVLITDENGAQVTGVSADEFQFQFRTDRTGSSVLTLTTTDATLTINEGITTTVLEIRVPQSSLSGLSGDYYADLVSKAASDDRLIHRAHGIVTFRDDPVAF